MQRSFNRVMQPFKLRVDWTAQRYYPEERVEVELLVLPADWSEPEPKVLRTFATVEEAVAWAVQWFKGRGLRFWCDVDRHERDGNSFAVLHCMAGMWVGSGEPLWRNEDGTFRQWPWKC